MASVDASGAPTRVSIIPMSAVLYDKEGKTWTYTNPAPLTFVRQQVDISHVDGEEGTLQSGPVPGTPVVTVGGEELLGSEEGVEGQ
jgi:hypothetical protein